VGPFAFGTVYASIIALVVAVPIAVGIALFISHYAPRRVALALGYIVDLLAAVPSVVFGVWGITVLSPALVPIMQWLEDNAGFLPFFEGPTLTSGRNMFTAGLVLAVMILPIITAICREVFLQTPRLHEEAALALGATRWEMIRMTVFPYGRSLAVALVLSGSAIYTFNTLAAENSGTIAANIALQFPEASGTAVNVLIATGLILFVITFAVNYTARKIVDRRSEFSGAN
jgi:phosphate transport system permease protein